MIRTPSARRFAALAAASLLAATASADAPDATIAALAEQPQTLQAFDYLLRDRDRMIDEMVRLNEIPAPPFGETERADALAALMRDAGLDVRRDAVGNVIGRRAGRSGRRSVAVVAHVDTVFPEGTDVTVRRDGSRFMAPGIGDNARGLALMLGLARALDAAGIRTADDVLFIGSVGEEGLGDLRGVRHLFSGAADAPRIDALIAIDGGPLERLVSTAVGSNRYRVTFRGPGGHSYGDFGRANPHHALAEAISRFERAAAKIAAAPGDKATFSVGRIGGGTSINAIAFESWMEVDMRSADPERLAALDTAFRDAIDAALLVENGRRRSGDALTVDVEAVGARPAGRTPSDARIVGLAAAALRAVDVEPVLGASSTDANVPMARGVPAVTISRGGISRNAHALNESWQDDGTQRAEQAALLLLMAEAGAVAR